MALMLISALVHFRRCVALMLTSALVHCAALTLISALVVLGSDCGVDATPA